MNDFDKSILELLNRVANRSHVFDSAVGLVSGSFLLKGGIFMAAIWWAWFSGTPGEAQARRRTFLIATLVAGAVAIALARGLGTVLPFRQRPLFSSELEFNAPRSANTSDFEDWSSFPSDHAALFFALATGLWYARRSLGLVAFAYAFVVVCLPRVYLGLHAPTDILAGAALGILTTWVTVRAPLRRAMGIPALRWLDRAPAWFYATLFLVTFQVGTLFADARGLMHLLGGS